MDGVSECKWCGDCGAFRSVLEFSYKIRDRGVFQSYCKVCQRRRSHEHYLRNAADYKSRIARNNLRIRTSNRERLHEYLRLQHCVDCGHRDMRVLEFDHRDPVTKRLDVSNLVSKAYSWKAILEEIKKCEVVCANCHRRRTAKQFGWGKLAEPEPLALPLLPPRGTANYERIKSLRSGMARRRRNRLLVWGYLKQHPCALCGEDDPIVMDFDHVGHKTRDIGWLITQSCTEKILAEIGNCRVLCANCHRMHTASAAGRLR
jgi:hypothetical protein